MKVELLWWEGCPSYPKALEDLTAVVREEGLDPATLEVREVTSDEQARRERFFGSPTIRIDGEDVQPASGSSPSRGGRPSPGRRTAGSTRRPGAS